MTNQDMDRFAKELQRKQPKHIHGYTLSLITFANYVQENGINLPPMQVSTTAETLESHHRDLLMKTFHRQVFDQYGCGECGSIAFECDAHEGLHISSEHVLVESTKNNSWSHEGNTCGDVVITDLDNFFMPIIRYKNGDMLELAEDECSCGRKLPLIKKIDGRITDSFTSPDGRIVHHGYFIHVLQEVDWDKKYNVFKYQIIQTSANSLKWNFVVKREPSKKDIEMIEKWVQTDFPGIDIEVHFVDSIPNESSGKFRYIKNMIGSK